MADRVLYLAADHDPQGVWIGLQNLLDGIARTFERDGRRFTIRTNVLQFARSEARRHGHDNGAERERRVKEFDDLHPVVEKEHDAVSRAEPLLLQSTGHAQDTLLKIAIGDALVLAYKRDLVRITYSLRAQDDFHPH